MSLDLTFCLPIIMLICTKLVYEVPMLSQKDTVQFIGSAFRRKSCVSIEIFFFWIGIEPPTRSPRLRGGRCMWDWFATAKPWAQGCFKDPTHKTTPLHPSTKEPGWGKGVTAVNTTIRQHSSPQRHPSDGAFEANRRLWNVSRLGTAASHATGIAKLVSRSSPLDSYLDLTKT